MPWTDDLVTMTRILLGDVTTPQRYTDAYLQQVLITAGILSTADLPLNTSYAFDLAALTILPDPVEQRDAVAVALWPLKAACLLNQSEYRQAIGQGIRVRDGDTEIDTSVGFRGWRDILELGPCASYERLRWQIQAQNSGESIGGAVAGPYRGLGDWVFPAIEAFYDTVAGSLLASREGHSAVP